MSEVKNLESLKAEAIRKALEYNAALAANNATGMESALNGLKETEKEYKKESFNEFVKTIRGTANPVLSAIKTLQFEVLKHSELKTEGAKTGIELYITDNTVNMAKVFERLGVPNAWSALAQKLNYMFTLRKALEHGIEGKDFQAIKDNYMIAGEVKKAMEGETPTSNNQMAKLLQSVIDALIFVPREDGENTYRALGYHINALSDWHITKNRRAIGTSDAAGDKAFDGYVVEIAHCIVTGKSLKMTGKNINGSKIEPKRDVIPLIPAEVAIKAKTGTKSGKKAKAAKVEEVAVSKDIPAVEAEAKV